MKCTAQISVTVWCNWFSRRTRGALYIRQYADGRDENFAGILFGIVCLQWLELFELCHWRASGSCQVRKEKFYYTSDKRWTMKRETWIVHLFQELAQSYCHFTGDGDGDVRDDERGILHDAVSGWGTGIASRRCGNNFLKIKKINK